MSAPPSLTTRLASLADSVFGVAWLNFGLAYRALRRAQAKKAALAPVLESALFPGTSHNLWFLAFTLPLLARIFPALRGTTHDQT